MRISKDDINDSIINRFWSKVIIKENDCWLWNGSLDKDGYGYFWIKDHTDRSHRVSYVINCGNIDPGLFVCHSCDNPSCVNPNHLFLGTARDNIDDMVTKNRQLCGSKNGHSKIDEELVYDFITRTYNNEFRNVREAADFYNINKPILDQIITHKSWIKIVDDFLKTLNLTFNDWKEHIVHKNRKGLNANYTVFESEEQINEIKELILSGQSLSSIGRKYNINPQNISNLKKRLGL